MSNRTVGDEIEDHYWGTQGVYTGSYSNQLGLDEHNRKQQQSGVIYTPSQPSGASGEIEDVLAGLIGLAVGIFVGISINSAGTAEAYWPWVGGIGSFLFTNWLLRGPLRFLMTLLAWIIGLAVLAGIAWLIWGQG